MSTAHFATAVAVISILIAVGSVIVSYRRGRRLAERERIITEQARQLAAARMALVDVFTGNLGALQADLPPPVKRRRKLPAYMRIINGGKAFVGLLTATALWRWISEHPRPIIAAGSAGVIAAVLWGVFSLLGPDTNGGRLAEPPGPQSSVPLPPTVDGSRTPQGTPTADTPTPEVPPPVPQPTASGPVRPTSAPPTAAPTVTVTRPEPTRSTPTPTRVPTGTPTRQPSPTPTRTEPSRTPSPSPTPVVSCLIDLDLELLPPALRAQLRALCQTFEEIATAPGFESRSYG